MNTQSIKDFAQSNNYVQVVQQVRINTNSYPFLTFIDAKNKAENIYFSKAASKMVTDGQTVTKGLLSSLMIGITINASGETRTKLISNSERFDLAGMLD